MESIYTTLRNQIALMRNRPFKFSLFVILAVFMSTSELCANSLELNVYGLSHHVLKEGESRNYLNEVNTGFGIRAVTGSDSTSWFLFEGGRFKDTFENQATYGSIGFLLRVYGQFRIGLNLAAYQTESLRAHVVAAPLPMATYTLWRVTLNVIYLPKYQGMNPFHTFGAYASLRLVNLRPKEKS